MVLMDVFIEFLSLLCLFIIILLVIFICFIFFIIFSYLQILHNDQALADYDIDSTPYKGL
jgi:hypothetical protein